MTMHAILAVRPLLAAFVVMTIALIPIPSSASMPDPQAASAHVEQVFGDATEILDADLPLAEREAAFRDLLASGLDVPTIGQFVLGRAWRTVTPQERARYLELVERTLIRLYARRIDSLYAGEVLTVSDAQVVNDRDVIVYSTIIGEDTGRPPVSVDWRVRRFDDGYRLIDVTIEGISLGVTQRSEYQSILNQNSGRIDALLDAMATRLAP